MEASSSTTPVSALPNKIVVIGAGHAGGNVVALLRQNGYEGQIDLVGDETIVPYHRPPLSKAFLKGETDAEGLKLRPDSFYTEQKVTLHLGTRAQSIDRAAKQVLLDDGSALPYDALILATGSRARKLPIPGAGLTGLFEMRNLADAEALKPVLGPGKRLALVGCGYIGLEAAAVARAFGADAVAIDRETRVLPRVASVPLSSYMHDYHAAQGVEFILNAGVQGFEGDAAGHLTGVRLGDGRLITCDAALVGVGAIANDELARAAGLVCENGIVVDIDARTSDPDIFAIGDVAWRPLPVCGDAIMFRLESVPNAVEGAKQAVAALLGQPRPHAEVPWFWSDQYDLKLQIASIPFDADEILLRGKPEDHKFALFHLKGDRIVAVEAVNCPGEFMMGRQLILQRKPIVREKLADITVSMKSVAA